MRRAGRDTLRLVTETTDAALGFYGAAWSCFEEACRRAPQNPSLWLDLGGSVLSLQFAGTAMWAQAAPALAHLAIEPRVHADLRVAVWDSASSGVAMARPPWSGDDYLARGEVRGLPRDGPIKAAYNPGSGVLSLLHAARGTAMWWLPDAAACPYYEQAVPLRAILHWWSSQRGWQMLHGAAVGDARGTVLLTGRGGSGKSTTALNALLAGMTYLGDDYVVCDPELRVHSLYNSAKLDDASLNLLPGLSGRLRNPLRAADEKGVLWVHEHFPESLRRSLPLRAILIPELTPDPDTLLQPVSPAFAFLALTPTTVFQLPGANHAAMGFLRRLVSAKPCYRLRLGSDLEQTPRLLSRLLGQLA